MNTHPRDILNLLSKLSFRRLTNAGSVVASYYWSRISGKALHPALPISISIEPTTSCNLRCPECPSGLRSFTRPTGMLQPEFFRKVIDEVNDRVLYLTFYFQGEPFLNPAFLDMVNYAAGKKMYTATSTNAHYLDDEMAKRTVESGLDRLIISIDGTTQETYEQYRIGGKLEKVLEGTRNIVKWKKQLNKSTPYLVFQFLVVKPNEHQTEEVKKLAKEMGVDDVAFKTAQVYDYENGNALIPDNGKYSRYRQQSDGTYTIKNKLLNHCWKLWHSCVITWDGNIVPCCFDKDAGHKMGNLGTQNFREIWNNESYQLFRNSLMKSRKEIDICKNCSEGTRVWAE
ncbi:MAG: SPASM domain-containing protein [Bacteroidetes bacterium]|nr:SPASM domain-containing protein [Bacteroidota bacterium]MBL0138130.1 SPASM domain-containing protein [Bacteroidota bacterium]